jgi:lipoprotein NlpD
MLNWRTAGWRSTAAVLLVAVLAGCASRSHAPAPVEDRTAAARPRPAPVAEAPRPAEAAKPGSYVVRPGDTLVRIALDAGQNWRDIARWNNIENPNVIEVGQVLRIVPPTTEVAVARPVAPAAVTATPVAPAASAAATPSSAAASAARTPSSGVVASVPPTTTASGPDEELGWIWPTPPGDGVVAGFDEQHNKGVDIAGKAGDPVLATADGRVVYAGAGLRGYGNLIILKHNNTYLSAYAHNQVLLVKEDQTVRKGQKIAEMGNTDSDRVKLHFEIRRQGKPVDPMRYLPAR